MVLWQKIKKNLSDVTTLSLICAFGGVLVWARCEKQRAIKYQIENTKIQIENEILLKENEHYRKENIKIKERWDSIDNVLDTLSKSELKEFWSDYKIRYGLHK